MIFPISQEDITIMNAIGWNLSPDVVYPGETLNIPDGQTSTGLMVIAGGVLSVASGGSVVNTDYNGGTGWVDGFDTNPVVSAGGLQYVFAGGSVEQALVIGVGTQIVAGGAAFNTYVGSGGTQIVELGGNALDSLVNSFTGLAVNTTVNLGTQIINAGGIALGTQVGGIFGRSVQLVGVGGQALNDQIIFSGIEQVFGLDVNATIGIGGSQIVAGTASGTTIDGGSQTLYPGGVVVSATVSGGGVQFLQAGSASATTIENGGVEVDGVEGTVDAAKIDSGGIENVYGNDYSATVSSGGIQSISGGRTVGTVVLTGGAQYVAAIANSTPGTADATVLRGGVENVNPVGIASNTVISSGGTENAFGESFGAQVRSGGSENVYGAETDGHVSSGGIQTVSDDGRAVGGFRRRRRHASDFQQRRGQQHHGERHRLQQQHRRTGALCRRPRRQHHARQPWPAGSVFGWCRDGYDRQQRRH